MAACVAPTLDSTNGAFTDVLCALMHPHAIMDTGFWTVYW